MDKEDPTQGIPDWLQPFTDNLEDLETHLPPHSSDRENSDSERAAKVAEAQFVLTSPKTEIATYACGPKLRGFLGKKPPQHPESKPDPYKRQP